MTLFRILALPAFCFPVLVGFSYARRFVVAKWLPQLTAGKQREPHVAPSRSRVSIASIGKATGFPGRLSSVSLA